MEAVPSRILEPECPTPGLPVGIVSGKEDRE